MAAAPVSRLLHGLHKPALDPLPQLLLPSTIGAGFKLTFLGETRIFFASEIAWG